ncbi:MAG TPA: hypothetical protein V6D17_16750 [Candidatus Obscuribacterales bacterium]
MKIKAEAFVVLLCMSLGLAAPAPAANDGTTYDTASKEQLSLAGAISGAASRAANETVTGTAAATRGRDSAAAFGPAALAATPVQTLSDLGDTLRKIEHAAGEIYREVNRHGPAPLSLQDVVDAQVMDPWGATCPSMALSSIQAMKVGPLLPPRKKWLDHDTKQLTDLLSILADEIKQIEPPPSLPEKMADSVKAELTVVKDAKTQIDSLIGKLLFLAQGPTFDHALIAENAKGLRANVEGMNESRKRLLKLLK